MLCPVEIKKTTIPKKKLLNVFGVIEKSPPKRGQEQFSVWRKSWGRLIGII